MAIRFMVRVLAVWLVSVAFLMAPMARGQNAGQPGTQIFVQGYGPLMNLAANAVRLGEWQAASVAAKAAFRAAGTDIERLNAARLVASAHFRAGQFSRAEWWLRRAANNASEGAGAAAVRQDFAQVSQANGNLNQVQNTLTISVFGVAGAQPSSLLAPSIVLLRRTSFRGKRIRGITDPTTDKSPLRFPSPAHLGRYRAWIAADLVVAGADDLGRDLGIETPAKAIAEVPFHPSILAGVKAEKRHATARSKTVR